MREICGSSIAVNDVCELVEEGFKLCKNSISKADESRGFYEKAVKEGRIYGSSTGLGALSSVEVKGQKEDKIIVEHDVGIGKVAPQPLVKLAMIIRLNQLSLGNAPVRSDALKRFEDVINSNIIPVVNMEGSVGASGDLAPFARIVRCIFLGEGEAFMNGKKVKCEEALKFHKLEKLGLETGEALALINTNAWSVAGTSLGVCIANRLLKKSFEVLKKTIEVTGCNKQHFSDEISQVKKPKGIKEALDLLGVECKKTPRLQDPYSIRCIPHIYGAALSALEYSSSLLEAESGSSSTNPFIYNGKAYHACNFHAIYAGLAADVAKIAIAYIGNSIERRIAHLLNSSTTGLPEFLASKDSPTGAMIYQYTAASLSAKLRGISLPMSVHSIPTSGFQEDVVSMAPNAFVELLRADSTMLMLIAIEDALAKQAMRVMKGIDIGDPRVAIENSLEEIIASTGLTKFREFLLETM